MDNSLNPKALTLFILGILVLASVIGFASATTIVSDNFEESTLDISWTVTNTDGVTGSGWADVGEFVKASPQGGTSTLERTFDVSGYENIEVGYDWELGDNLEDNENLTVEWSADGNVYETLNVYSHEGASSEILSLSSSADDSSTLSIRFSCTSSAVSETCILDNVIISGTEIPAPALTVSAATISSNSNSTEITVKNTGNVDLTSIQLTASTGYDVEFNDTGFNLAAGASKSVSVTRTSSLTSLDYGPNKITITATASDGTSAVALLTSMRDFYEGPNEGELEISDIQFNTLKGFGDDENYWYPLDEVEVRFDVDNNGDWDARNIEVSACLYDLDAKRCVLDEGDMELSDDKFDIDSGDSKRVTLTFNINPDDLREGHTDYTVFLSVEGEVDDKDSPYDGDSTGISDSQDIEIRTTEEFVIVDNIQVPQSVSCGQTAQLTAEVWNIGDADLDDDEVFLYVSNSALNLGEKVQFLRGIRAMDSEIISLAFNIPEDVEETQYRISFVAYDDERMDNNDVIENREGDKAEYVYFMDVKCSPPSAKNLVISANLESEAKAGEEMSIKITLANTGDTAETYTIKPSGYQSWATVSQLPSAIAVPADGSGEGILKLNVNDDASGSKQFSLDIYSGSELVATQAVSVNIESRSWLTGSAIGGNAALWGFGVLNVILLIVIIIVAVRVAARK